MVLWIGGIIFFIIIFPIIIYGTIILLCIAILVMPFVFLIGNKDNIFPNIPTAYERINTIYNTFLADYYRNHLLYDHIKKDWVYLTEFNRYPKLHEEYMQTDIDKAKRKFNNYFINNNKLDDLIIISKRRYNNYIDVASKYLKQDKIYRSIKTNNFIVDKKYLKEWTQIRCVREMEKESADLILELLEKYNYDTFTVKSYLDN